MYYYLYILDDDKYTLKLCMHTHKLHIHKPSLPIKLSEALEP